MLDRTGGQVTADGADEHPDRPLLLGVAAAARRLGVAPATLRTWDRRYGLGPSQHAPGAHRRYTATDLARLDLMRRELLHGAPAAEAARRAHAAGPRTRHPVPVRVVDPQPLRAAARGLGRAAVALDADAVDAQLRAALDRFGVVATWDGVIRPVLAGVADRWATSGAGVEVEHLLSGCAQAVFGGQVRPAADPDPAVAPGPVPIPDPIPDPAADPDADLEDPLDLPAAGRPAVLLAAMPGEQHVLPLVALAAALRECGVRCRPLGADLPLEALAAAVRRTAPAVVVLWSQLPDTADVAVLRGLPRTRPRPRTYVGGPGWAGTSLPVRVPLLVSLGAACDEICRAVEG